MTELHAHIQNMRKTEESNAIFARDGSETVEKERKKWLQKNAKKHCAAPQRASLLAQLLLRLGEETCILDDGPFVDALAHHALIISGGDLKHQPAAVDLGQLCPAGDR